MSGRRTPSTARRAAVDRREKRVAPVSVGALGPECLLHRGVTAVGGSESSASSARSSEAGTAAPSELLLADRGGGEESRLAEVGSVGGCGMRRPPPSGCAWDPSIRTTWIRDAVEGRRPYQSPRETSLRRDLEDLGYPTAASGRLSPSGGGWPAGGTMDTSRGPDGPIDSRTERQLRLLQGLHIMMWRQIWRQMR
jgi:hypothetical protein